MIFAEFFDRWLGDPTEINERLSNPEIIADRWVGIKREMHGIQSNIVFDKLRDALVEESRDGTFLSPKESVVHDEKIDFLENRPLKNKTIRIDGITDFVDFGRSRVDLESIFATVLEFLCFEKMIEIRYEFGFFHKIVREEL